MDRTSKDHTILCTCVCVYTCIWTRLIYEVLCAARHGKALRVWLMETSFAVSKERKGRRRPVIPMVIETAIENNSSRRHEPPVLVI